ncbi:MAG: Rv2175c family DNA-binding protein [Dermatophilaceae bacterium]
MDDAMEPQGSGIEGLVGRWLTIPDLADRVGMSLGGARRLVEDREVLAVRVGERQILSVPEAFVGDEGPLPPLRGTFTVLADGGMDDADIIRWLFTDDDTLPVPGSPLDALRAGFTTEVRRRAMEQAL